MTVGVHTGVRRAAAALGLLVLAVGCSKGTPAASPTPSGPPTGSFTSSTPTAVATIPTTAPTTPATTGPTPTPRSSATPAPGSKDFGYFPSTVSSSPPVLEFDRALFLTGKDADKASAAHGGESPVPNDYYIQNDSKLLRRLTLAPDVTVIGSLQLNSFVTKDDYSTDPEKHTLKDLLAFLRTSEGPRTPWHLTYGTGGRVSTVEEQYLP